MRTGETNEGEVDIRIVVFSCRKNPSDPTFPAWLKRALSTNLSCFHIDSVECGNELSDYRAVIWRMCRTECAECFRQAATLRGPIFVVREHSDAVVPAALARYRPYKYDVVLRSENAAAGELFDPTVAALELHQILAGDIARSLEPEVSDDGPAIFIGDTVDALYFRREQLRTFLQTSGRRVAPEFNLYSEGTACEYDRALEEEMEQAGVFVQLLSREPAIASSDRPERFLQSQFEAASLAGLEICQWAGEEPVEGMDPFQLRLLEGSTVQHKMTFARFREDVLKRSRTVVAKPEGGRPRILVIGGTRLDAAQAIVSSLSGLRFAVDQIVPTVDGGFVDGSGRSGRFDFGWLETRLKRYRAAIVVDAGLDPAARAALEVLAANWGQYGSAVRLIHYLRGGDASLTTPLAELFFGNEGLRDLAKSFSPGKRGGGPRRIFYSYAREDQKWVKKLREELNLLRLAGLIEDWADFDMAPGQRWSDAIEAKITNADVILLLISPRFFGQGYADTIELRAALNREGESGRTVPVLIEEVVGFNYTNVFLLQNASPEVRKNILELWSVQSLPKKYRPIVSPKWSPREGVKDAAEGIRAHIESSGSHMRESGR